MDSPSDHLPEIWGGLECTINRIGDKYVDQLELSGFYQNASQLTAIVELGIKRMRFPVLWEKHQQRKFDIPDFSWAKDNIDRLAEAGVEPVIGLLHHGSGPGFTDLADDNFPFLFADYARAVAQAFPHVDDYTPVNEPLTTARFSGLYGHWYPHQKGDESFIKILMNELKATVLAMREIRKVNPRARLLQTEDLGKSYSTPLLKYQADFENQRRWLTYDLLCGKVKKEHPLYQYLSGHLQNTSSLEFFMDNPCPPEMIGVNHYLTSERFLDEDHASYPGVKPGGNGIHDYADVEAARVNFHEPHGAEHLIQEVWNRYKIPLVISEVHLHCTRDEQLRWLKYIYDITVRLKRKKVDIRAVTAWALTGSFGWSDLLTRWPGKYESGAFDISTGRMRETAVASLIRKLSLNQSEEHSVLATSGWWKSPDRFFKHCGQSNSQEICIKKPLLITGKTGTLGKALARLCRLRNIPFMLTGRDELDLSSSSSISKIISLHKPWAIINAAGYVKLDQAEVDRSACITENSLGVKNLAEICDKQDIKLVTFSTDQVFDGCKTSPYVEEDNTAPLNQYGISKQLAENFLSDIMPKALLIRTAAFFGPWDKHNFAYHCVNELSNGNIFAASTENFISPTYVPHLAQATLDLLIDEAFGIYHITNKGCESWYSFAEKLADKFGLSKELLVPLEKGTGLACRPVYAAMESKKYGMMPTLDAALQEYKEAVGPWFNKNIKHNTEYERV